ncbi:hypothetical protein, partial [Thiolapillus sp.]|uniref:hypothetical protein n=1 Tax=Thiolapillus sp. TaxID=2017437 RepID=UPI003AF801FD
FFRHCRASALIRYIKPRERPGAGENLFAAFRFPVQRHPTAASQETAASPNPHICHWLGQTTTSHSDH